MLDYNKKIFIDRTFGFAVAFMMKVVTRLVGLLLKRDHSLPDNPKVIVVAKIVGLGSILYTGILCRSMKERFPQAKIVYITSVTSLELVRHMNYVDEVFCINDKTVFSMITTTLSLILTLYRLRPQLYFDMEVYSSWAAIIATFSCALNRYGFYRKSATFKKGMHTHMIFFNTKRHISEIYSQMALCAGGKINNSLYGILNISSEDKAHCSEILREMNINNSNIILVNVNASDLLPERRWPERKWVNYLEKSVNYFPNYSFLLIGAPNESENVSTIHNALSPNNRGKVFNVAGKFPLGAFLGLIETSSLMVTNDSGPLHFAVALGKPTVSIWGPGDPEHYGPLHGPHKIIYEPVFCSPCLYHADFPPCEGNNVCVRDIAVATVREATKQIISFTNDNMLGLTTSSVKDVSFKTAILNREREFNPVIKHKKQ